MTNKTYKTGRHAAKAYAKKHGVHGKAGGWIYTASERPLCQGWDGYVSMLVHRGVIRDLDGGRLGVRSVQPKNPWEKVPRNVFDRKPVVLVEEPA